MTKTSVKAAIGALLIAATCQASLAAGPVTPLQAPSSIVEVKNNKGAAAVGAVAGAAIMLGILGAASAANAAPPPEETYVEPRRYGYVEVPDGYDDYYSYVLDNPRSAVEVCRKGILSAARQYGASRAKVTNYYNIRDAGDDTVKFRADITVYYPGAARRSTVVCSVQNGYLVAARAAR